MKLQKRKMPWQQYEALRDLIRSSLVNVEFDNVFGSHIVALTDEFQHTTNINDARWLYTDNQVGYSIVRIDNNGAMIHLGRE
jgi:hypothetical protein